MEKSENTPNNQLIGYCPFLGFREDKDTTLSYPSHQNCCYHAKPIESVNLEYQQQFCLKPSFETCTVYGKEKIERLPKEVSSNKRRRQKSRLWIWIIGIILTVLILGVGSIAFNIIKIPGLSQPLVSLISSIKKLAIVSHEVFEIPVTGRSSPTLEATQYANPKTTTEVLSTITPTTITPTTIMNETPTPFPTILAPHSLETPFGLNTLFVIHRLVDGEGLIVIAQKYNTSVDAIKAVNYKMPQVLIVGKMIVVPVNMLTISGLRSFSIYEVEEPTMTIIEIAAKFQVEASSLALNNALPENFVLSKGDLLIVPHENNQ